MHLKQVPDLTMMCLQLLQEGASDWPPPEMSNTGFSLGLKLAQERLLSQKHCWLRSLHLHLPSEDFLIQLFARLAQGPDFHTLKYF